MKSALIISVLSLMTAAPSFAMAPNALLTMSETNGTVAPTYSKLFECSIFADRVVKSTRVGLGEPEVTSSQVQFTADVANVAMIQKLVSQANKGKITHGPDLIGGGVTAYYGLISLIGDSTKQVPLLMKGGDNTKNNSSAAKRLVKFIQFNCEKQ